MTQTNANGRPRTARQLAKSAATRRRVIDAAARVLYRQGYAGTRLSDIADDAGLQTGSLYYYFDSREQLVEEVLRYGVQFTHDHVRNVVEQMPETATAGDRLGAAIRGYLEAILELGQMSPAFTQSFHQLPGDMQERLRPLRRAFGQFWEKLIGAAVESGEVRSDIDPYVLRLFIINSVQQVAGWPGRARAAAPDLADTVCTLIFSGAGGAERP